MAASYRKVIVCGSGMSGLFTALAVSAHADEVVVLESDALTEPSAPRHGVPQGSHPHGILLRGVEVLERISPGLFADVISDGGVKISYTEDISFEVFGSRLPNFPSPYHVVCATRPFIESRLRARVLATPGISMRAGVRVKGIVAEHGRVTGVRVSPIGTEPGVERVVEGDLVLDTMGKSSRAPDWLEGLGYPAPPERRLDYTVRYSTFRFQPTHRMPPARGQITLPGPETRRGVLLLPQESGTWIASLTGFEGTFTPPRAPDEFLAAARPLLSPDQYSALRAGEPLTGISRYRFPPGFRRHFERLRRHPEGMISLGDSLCTLNPLYGTGITNSAEMALALRDCLDHRDGTTLATRFYAAAAQAVRTPWMYTLIADQALNPPTGRSLKTTLAKRGLRLLASTASRDVKTAERLLRTLGGIDRPLALVSPDALTQMLVGRYRARARDEATKDMPNPDR